MSSATSTSSLVCTKAAYYLRNGIDTACPICVNAQNRRHITSLIFRENFCRRCTIESNLSVFRSFEISLALLGVEGLST
jgi:hypothetical protein